MTNWQTPAGMTRRHFMNHLAGSTAAAGAALTLGNSIIAHADELKTNRKSAILLWMGGGPPTIDIWDLKPGGTNGRTVPADRDDRRHADLRAPAVDRSTDASLVDRPQS